MPDLDAARHPVGNLAHRAVQRADVLDAADGPDRKDLHQVRPRQPRLVDLSRRERAEHTQQVFLATSFGHLGEKHWSDDEVGPGVLGVPDRPGIPNRADADRGLAAGCRKDAAHHLEARRHGGRFRIDGVTGPDEYSAIADNNVYTNLLAQRNLRAAASAVARHPRRAAELGAGLEEAAAWRDAAENMVVPWDDALGVHPQSEGFTDHQPWDFANTTPEQYPLLLHFPYFDLYRKQVIKQADLVLALHWRGDAFTDEEKARDFDYYEAMTVRDSSLSACTQAVIAAEVGHLELAYDYFGEAALMDLHDLEHNTRDGVHIASLAGAWIAAVAGFGGMRDHDGHITFAPRLPATAPTPRLPAPLPWAPPQGRSHEDARHLHRSSTATPLEVGHHGKTITVSPNETVTEEIPPVAERPAPSQPPGRAPARRGEA